MASLQKKGDSYYCQFCYHGKRYTFTVGAVSEEEAGNKSRQVDYLLMRLKQRLIVLPDGVDIVTFVEHDGKPPSVDGIPIRPAAGAFAIACGPSQDVFHVKPAFARCWHRSTEGTSMNHAHWAFARQISGRKLDRRGFDPLFENCFRSRYAHELSLRTLANPEDYKHATIDRNRRQLGYLHGNLDGYFIANIDEDTRYLKDGIADAMGRLLDPYQLVVVGYSGRDSSVMSVLNHLAEHRPSCFRHGVIYWCRRPGEDLSPTFRINSPHHIAQ